MEYYIKRQNRYRERERREKSMRETGRDAKEKVSVLDNRYCATGINGETEP